MLDKCFIKFILAAIASELARNDECKTVAKDLTKGNILQVDLQRLCTKNSCIVHDMNSTTNVSEAKGLERSRLHAVHAGSRPAAN